MKYTLLEMVQLILSAMDSDEVNSINDTVESTQVALLLKSVYYDMITDLNVPEIRTLLELNASGDNAKPTLMTVPDNATGISWIKYDNRELGDAHALYQDIMFLDFEEFLKRQNALREEVTDVGEMNFIMNSTESFPIMYRTDAGPKYYTTLNNRTILFDSYDSTQDTTLQKNKCMCYGSVYPAFTLSDGFIPELDPTQFSYYINAAKVRAFSELKQAQNQEAAGTARRAKIVAQKRMTRVPVLTTLERTTRYGRR